MREKFVRPLVGRQSREGRVRARFRRMRVVSEPRVRITGKAKFHVNYLGSTNYMRR